MTYVQKINEGISIRRMEWNSKELRSCKTCGLSFISYKYQRVTNCPDCRRLSKENLCAK